jgi:tetratricopeptide (TPR) repeat protein
MLIMQFRLHIILLLLLLLFSWKVDAQSSETEVKDANYISLRQHLDSALKAFNLDKYDKVLHHIEKGMEYCTNDDFLKERSQLLGLEGYVYLNRGLPQKSLSRFSEMLSAGKIIQDTFTIIGAYHGKSRSFIELEQYNEAIQLLNEGIDRYIKPAQTNRTLAVFYNALGMAYGEADLPLKALEYYQSYERISREIKDSTFIVYALVNQGEVYNTMKNLEKARYYLHLAQELNLRVQNGQAKAAIAGNFAQLCYETADFENAKRYLLQAFNLGYSSEQIRFLDENYQLLAKVYDSLGLADSSIWILHNYLAFKDSMFEADKVNTIHYMDAFFSMEEKEHEAEIVEQKLKNRTILLSLSITSFILVLLLLILIYSRYKLRIRLHAKETEKLSMTIDEKNRELVGKLLNEGQWDAYKEQRLEDLEQALSQENLSTARNVLADIQKHGNHRRPGTFDWENFKVHFEQVHPDFFKNLKKEHNELTVNDLRHCAYIRMNLTTKEIAGLLHVSDRSVQTSRYRIKKKLELDKDIDLTHYIQGI